MKIEKYLKKNKITHPLWHMMSVSFSVMIVENHDGGDNTAGHHEHDTIEIGACNITYFLSWEQEGLSRKKKV